MLSSQATAFALASTSFALTDVFGWVGAVIDDQFAIEAVAGEGGFGIVYRAVHLGFEVPVAVKCLKLPIGLSEMERRFFLERIRREARLMHRLSRRTAGIVQALDVGAATSPSGVWTPYIVMEWIEGRTLEEDLRARRESREEPRGLDEAIRIIAPAVTALSIAHEEDVAHLDLKPANLVLGPGCADAVAKVLDFGIAKVFSGRTTSSGQERLSGGAARGFTPEYGAPEQFSAQYGRTGPWTDVFAVALLLIEVASGRRALEGEGIAQLHFSSIDEGNRARILERVPGAARRVGAVLRRALDIHPASRYRDLRALWSALDEARTGASSPGTLALPRDRCGEAQVSKPAACDLSTPPACGTRGSRSTGEHRVCTVVSIDLSTVTDLTQRLDPEDVKAILDRCQQVAAEQVQGMGGVVEYGTWARVLGFFGVPCATDNDAERAVVAALRIQVALPRVALPRPVRSARIAANIGIATGRVFAERAQGATREQFIVVGDALKLAERLDQVAPPGAIVIGRDTYRQVLGLFNVVGLSSSELPGGREATSAYRVLGRSASRAPITSFDFHGRGTRFVGRVTEMQRVLDALDTVLAEGRTHRVTLVGAPGMGRSRMLSELSSALLLRGESLLVLSASCTPLSRGVSYGLVAAMIRRRFGILESDPAPRIRRKLRRGLRVLSARGLCASWKALREMRAQPPCLEPHPSRAELDEAICPVEAVLGARSGNGLFSVVDGAGEAGRMTKHRIVAAVERLLRFAARRMPVVMLCDDLQWADDASLDLLDEVSRRGDDMPIFVVGTARPELMERRFELREEGYVHEQIYLRPLARRHMEEMIRNRLDRVRDLPLDLLADLIDRAEGNPLILEETLHLLTDAGEIDTGDGDHWAVRRTQRDGLALPTTIQGIVQARIDRLDPEARGVLSRAAIVGRTFWQGAVERLHHPDLPGVPSSLVGVLSALRDRKLFRDREPSTFPGERESVFTESATHEVAYDMTSLKLRRSLHLVVAEWLEERNPSAASAALLATHYERGGDGRSAASESARAASHAAALGDSAEAVRHLERARDLHDAACEESVEGAWDGQERRIASWRDRVQLLLDLGDALRRVGRLEEAVRVHEAARARILLVERRAGCTMGPGEVPCWKARVDFGLALVHKVRGAIPQARAGVERAISRATGAGAVEETPPMYALLAFLHRREQHAGESWQAALRGLRVCRSLPRHDERWKESVAQLLFGVAAALYARGRMIAAERTYRQASRVVSEVTNPHLVGIALNGVAGARLACGDLRGAREALFHSLRLKERAGDLHQIAVAYSNLAEVELRLGDAATALQHARVGVHLGEQARAGSDLADMYRNLAEASLAVGELDAALNAGMQALSIAEVSGRVYLSEVAAALARVCAAVVDASPVDSAAKEKAAGAATALLAALPRHLEGDQLRWREEACRALLGPAMVGS